MRWTVRFVAVVCQVSLPYLRIMFQVSKETLEMPVLPQSPELQAAVVRRSLRRQRGKFPFAAGGGSVVAGDQRSGIQTDIETRITGRRNQPPDVIALDDVEEAGGGVLPARVQHATPRIVATWALPSVPSMVCSSAAAVCRSASV